MARRVNEFNAFAEQFKLLRERAHPLQRTFELARKRGDVACHNCGVMAESNKIRGLGGGAILALLIIGVLALLLALGSTADGHREAAAIALLAGAVAFTGIANVVFRA